MARMWDSIKKEVAEKIRRERAEEDANRLPKAEISLRSVFPARERILGSMDFRTVSMKVDNLWYRLVLDRMRDREDQEGAITLEVWRETQRLHRQVSVVAELHRFILSWDGTIIDVSVLSIPGNEKALADHPAVFEVGRRRKGFTASSFPVDVMRLMGREAVRGTDLTKRFLFHLIAAKDVCGQQTLDNFVRNHSGRDIINLLQYLEVGAFFARPTAEEAGFDNIEVAGRKKSPPGPMVPARNKEKVVRHDVDSTTGKTRMAGTEFKRPQGGADRRVTRRSLWTNGDGTVSEEETGDESLEEAAPQSASPSPSPSPDPHRVRARARYTLMGGHDWRNFQPEQIPTMMKIAKARGDDSVPLGYDLGPTGNDSMRANSSLDTSGAGVSPRGELSQHSVTSSEHQVSMVDLTGASSEEDRRSTSFSPFLAKRPRTVVNVGSTSSTDEVMETSAVEAELEAEVEAEREKRKEKEGEGEATNDLLDESVILESGEGDIGGERC